MKIALWIIAVCSAVRIVQNGIQLAMLFRDADARNDAYAGFIKSLRYTDREFVKFELVRLLEELDKAEDGKEDA